MVIFGEMQASLLGASVPGDKGSPFAGVAQSGAVWQGGSAGLEVFFRDAGRQGELTLNMPTHHTR